METVVAQIAVSKSKFDEAKVKNILQVASERIKPRCKHYQTCGGCSLQHAEFSAQVAYKQRIFEEQLQRIGKVHPQQILPALYGEAWHYRHRTRLSIQVDANGQILIGFLAKGSHKVQDISECWLLVSVLANHLSTIKNGVKTLCKSLPKSGIYAVELYSTSKQVALNIISQIRLPEERLLLLQRELHSNAPNIEWQIWQQQDKQAVYLVTPKDVTTLSYRLPEFSVELPFQPGDFTQVNTALNERMVARAMQLLEPQPNERIADLFCGLGNFSLPLARSGAKVVGIEGASYLTERAKQNARVNGLNNVCFQTANLFKTTQKMVKKWGYFDKMLLDPPRAGALAVVESLVAPYLPKRIVYISCNPSTFARDIAVFVDKGYHFQAAGMMNLFSQTTHIECIGLMTRE